jgi:DNA-binding IclR family transcriptional regulator
MPNNYIVPAVDRAIDVLDYLATSKSAVSLHELSIQTGVPKSTLFRILYTLEKHRFIEQDIERKKFCLGFKLWELGNVKIETTEIATIAIKHMRTLADQVCENVFLGVLDNQEVIYIQRIECSSKVKAITKLGRRAPAYCTATGQAIIAFLEDDEITSFINEVKFEKFNDTTITDKETLLRKLKQIRENGYSVANGEYNPELLCVSAPIKDYSRKVVASITVDMLTSKQNLQKVKFIAKELKAAVDLISRELGFSV